MANIYKNVGVHWGTSSTTTSIVSGQLQTRDHTKKADMEEIKNGDGNVVGKVYYNQTDDATFEWIPTSATVNGTLTVTLPAIGDKITVSDSIYADIAKTNWLVEEVSTKSSNTSCLKATAKLTAYPNIT